ncbi:MAG TPA: alpha/beta fold hydrolase [Jatrophihabitans sp.]
MTRFVLVPGAGGSAWYWHRVVAELDRRGHESVAVELPGADPDAGLPEYRDLIVAAARQLGGPVVLVAQSLGGFSAPLVCAHVPVERLVLVNAMIPKPGETAGEWWDAVGWFAAAKASADRDGRPTPDVTDLDTLFFHDLPLQMADIMRSDRGAAAEGPAVFGQPWSLDAWPDVTTTVLSGRDDRLFPVALQRHVARDRLGLEVETLSGGHLIALSQPITLTHRLTSL